MIPNIVPYCLQFRNPQIPQDEMKTMLLQMKKKSLDAESTNDAHGDQNQILHFVGPNGPVCCFS